MHKHIVERLLARFGAYADLVAVLDDDLLTKKIDLPRHKSLAEHLWCVIGARESYALAITKGAWAGFNCSVTDFGVCDFREKLAESSAALEAALERTSDWTDERNNLLVALAEHEVMHEGQIIRHMYALEQELPSSWVWA